ncbi:MAG: DinB family protein [Pseudomonadota bacterium]
MPGEALLAETGALWGSILKTFNHILWANRLWMSRFEGQARPTQSMAEGALSYDTFDEMIDVRDTYDHYLVEWADQTSDPWLASTLSFFSGAAGREIQMPCGFCVTHFFNHQTHHRGQVHAMLTMAGAKTTDTDLVFMLPEAWP